MKKILIVITALLMAANAGNTQSLSKFLKGANKVLETLNEMTEEPQKTPQQEKNPQKTRIKPLYNRKRQQTNMSPLSMSTPTNSPISPI